MKLVHTDVVRVLEEQEDVWSVIKDISEEAGREEAFYVCDLGDIVKKHMKWMKKLPRVKQHYAVKCNDSKEVLKTLAALGAGFDCASAGEIQKVLELGVHPDRIIYANPVKAAKHLRYAAEHDVEVMTFDNEDELIKIKKIYPNAKLVIRIRCDAAKCVIPLGAKFGCDVSEGAPTLLDKAKALGLHVIGVSFHIGSDCGDSEAYCNAIAASRQVFDYANSHGHRMYLLDIGGGFPGNKDTSIDDIADTVNAALGDFFPDPSITVVAEPGRFYVASAYTLVTNVHSKRMPSPQSTQTMYYINDGAFISFLCVHFENWKVKPIPIKKHSSELVPSTIWGPTCDSCDRVAENVLLPNLDIGEWLVFENMGAYTLPLATGFNAFPKPSVHLVASRKIWTHLKGFLLDDLHFVPSYVVKTQELSLEELMFV